MDISRELIRVAQLVSISEDPSTDKESWEDAKYNTQPEYIRDFARDNKIMNWLQELAKEDFDKEGNWQ